MKHSSSMAGRNSTETVNETYDCMGELDIGFDFLYVTVPVNAIIVLKSALVILTVYRTPSLHTNANIIAASLSLSDVLMATAFINIGDSETAKVHLSVDQIRIIKTFVFGEFSSSILISIGHMGIIAIDRYILIAHPFYYIKHMTKRRIYFLILCVWVIGIFLLFYPLFVYNRMHYYDKCISLHPSVDYYLVCSSVYVSTFVIVLVSYSKIAILAFAHKKAANIRKLVQHGNRSDSVFKDNRAAAFRSVKFFALMFGVFVICTLPPAVATGLTTFYLISHQVFVCFSYLVLLNSLISFAIYFSMNTALSRALKKTCSDLLAFTCIRRLMNREGT